MTKLLYVFRGALLISTLAFSSIAISAQADQVSNKTFLVTVKDFNSEKSLEKLNICDAIKRHAPMPGHSVLWVRENVDCIHVSEFDFEDDGIKNLLAKKKYDYHIEAIKESGNERLVVNTHNLTQLDELDFKKTQTLYFGGATSLFKSLVNHLEQVQYYANHSYILKVAVLKQFLLVAPEYSGLTHFDHRLQKMKYLVDYTWRDVMKKISLGNDDRYEVARSYIQIAATLAFASYIYWKNLVVNREDFDYPTLDKKVKDTLFSTRGWNFDTNKEVYNTGHAFAGAVYYLTARNNGFSALASFAITNISSLYWEIIGERKESASIGDQFITGIGGSILAEPAYQLARLMRKKSNSIMSRILRTVIDPLGALNRNIDRAVHGRTRMMEGLNDEDFNRIETTIAKGIGGDASYKLALTGDMMNVENYGMPGLETGIVVDLPESKVMVEISKGKLNGNDIRLLTQVAWLGYYQKKVQENSEGYSALVSVGGEFDYHSRQDDYNLNVNMIGPQIRVDGMIRGIRVHAEAAVYADFVMMKSLALPDFDGASPQGVDLASGREGLQSHVKRQGHYYGFGSTQKIKFALSYRDWTAYVSIRQSQVKSQQGRDRFQNLVTMNDSYRDTKRIIQWGLRYEISSSLALSLRSDKIARTGTMRSNLGVFERANSTGFTWLELHHKW